MTPRKKLIEVALPLEAINEASAREKSIRHGHPSTLHLWWARRPLAAARAVIFSSLVDDPDSLDALPAFVEACRTLPYIGKNVHTNGDTPRMRLFDFIETLVQWESTTNEEVLKTARELIMIATEGNPPPLLDPFAGGGSIPLEAQRLGLEAHASDLNPVAVMINKAQIEIPPRFANMPPVNPRDRERISSSEGWKGAAGLAADVRYYGEWMREKAWERIGHLYPKHNGKTIIAWLWARTVRCPNPACGAQMPLVRSFWLSKKKGNYAWLMPIVDRGAKSVWFDVKNGEVSTVLSKELDTGTGILNENGKSVQATFRCIVCEQGIVNGAFVDNAANEGTMSSMPLAMVLETKNGREYSSFDNSHVRVALDEAQNLLKKSNFDALIPTEPSRGTFASNAQGRYYGFKEFSDYFTDRQLVGLITLIDLLSVTRQQIYQDAIDSGLKVDDLGFDDGGLGVKAYSESITVYLGMAISRLTDIFNALCRWESTKTQVRNLFGRQAIPMMWDFAENNLFSDAAGDFLTTLGSMIKTIERMPANLPAFVKQLDAHNISTDYSVVVSTDPPYYGNVNYADLSDFFYVWLRRSLRDIYPETFGTKLVPKEAEITATPHRFNNNREAANAHFEHGLKRTFANLREIVQNFYPMTVYYAFKQSDTKESEDETETFITSSSGWETMLQGLIESGFSIHGTWPMRTELSNRMVGIGSNALASSIVLVCRPRPEDAPTNSRRQFVDALRRELPAALKEMQSGNIAPVDLAQASIGPGMAIYSRYSKVLEADGSAMSVRTALGLINQELDAYLSDQDGDIDADTRFAVSWFQQFGFNEGPFGDADNLARAKNTSVEGVTRAGVVSSGRGKVKLIHWTEYDAGILPLKLPFTLGGSANWNPQEDKRPTVWEAVHHLIERLNTQGEDGAATLLLKLPPDMAAEARNLAYRLYSVCERKGWADLARDYNGLVISWAGVGERSAELRDSMAQGQATDQPRLFE